MTPPDEPLALQPLPTEDAEAEAPASLGWRGVLIDERSAGRRVDSWLAARFPAWSRTVIQQKIRAGEVTSEERSLKPSSTLYQGERLRITMPGLAPEGPPPPLPPVIHEDDRLIAFDKPSGLLVHPAGQRWTWALIGLARQRWPTAHLDLVHRLDRETSGVCLMTKDSKANARLKKAFQLHRVNKTYQVLVHGRVPWDRQEVDAPLGPNPRSEVRIRQAVIPHGAEARTTFRVLERLERHTLLAADLHTGRTHQIRAHLEHLGFPVLGDKLYGQPDSTFLRLLEHGADPDVRAATGFPRHALHAWRLYLPHPDGHELRIVAPLPQDMANIVAGGAPTWPDDAATDSFVEPEQAAE